MENPWRTKIAAKPDMFFNFDSEDDGDNVCKSDLQRAPDFIAPPTLIQAKGTTKLSELHVAKRAGALLLNPGDLKKIIPITFLRANGSCHLAECVVT